MDRRTWLSLGVAALGGAALPACVKKPTMTLVGAEMTGVSFGFPPRLAALLNIYLDVHNPNGYDVGVRAVRGQTLLAGRHVVPVDYRAPGDGLWLGSRRVTRIQVPVEVPAQVGAMVLAETFGSPTVHFQFRGKADVTAFRSLKIESDDWSVDEQGFITREQIVRALPGL